MPNLSQRGRHEQAQALPCPESHEVRRRISEASESGSKKARTSKREWKWQRGVATLIHSVKANGAGPLQHEKVGDREAQELVHANSGFQGPRCPLTALSWRPLGSGELVAGQWCNWIMMKNRCFCMVQRGKIWEDFCTCWHQKKNWWKCSMSIRTAQRRERCSFLRSLSLMAMRK